MENNEVATTETTIPCGWCDEPVSVVEDHGQVVYCSEAHAQSDCYVPGVQGNL